MYDDHGQWPAREQWEDPGFEGQDSHGNHPMTEEEAEWEWQRQLAEQEGSQEEDDRSGTSGLLSCTRAKQYWHDVFGD